MKTARDFVAAAIALAVTVFAGVCFLAALQEASLGMMAFGALLLMVPLAVASDVWSDLDPPLRERPAFSWARVLMGGVIITAALFDGARAFDTTLIAIGSGVIVVGIYRAQGAIQREIEKRPWVGFLFPGALFLSGLSLMGRGLAGENMGGIGAFFFLVGMVLVFGAMGSGREPFAEWVWRATGVRLRAQMIVPGIVLLAGTGILLWGLGLDGYYDSRIVVAPILGAGIMVCGVAGGREPWLEWLRERRRNRRADDA